MRGPVSVRKLLKKNIIDRVKVSHQGREEGNGGTGQREKTLEMFWE